MDAVEGAAQVVGEWVGGGDGVGGGEAPDGLAAVSKAAELRVDVVVMDVRMPRLNGIEATRRLVALTPKPQVVLLTT